MRPKGLLVKDHQLSYILQSKLIFSSLLCEGVELFLSMTVSCSERLSHVHKSPLKQDHVFDFQGQHKPQNLRRSSHFPSIIHWCHPSLEYWANFRMIESTTYKDDYASAAKHLEISQKQEHGKTCQLSSYARARRTCHRVFFFGDSSSFWSSITDVF